MRRRSWFSVSLRLVLLRAAVSQRAHAPAAAARSPGTSPSPATAADHLARITVAAQPWSPNDPMIALQRANVAPGGTLDEIAKPSPERFSVERGPRPLWLLSGPMPPRDLNANLPPVVPATPAARAVPAVGHGVFLVAGASVELRDAGAALAAALFLADNASTSPKAHGATWDLTGSSGLTALLPTPLVVPPDRCNLPPRAQIGAASAPAVTAVGLVDPPYGYLAAGDGPARNLDQKPRVVHVRIIAPLAGTATPTA